MARAEDVRFSADRLELDPKLSRLELRGHVQIAAYRYRLTGDRLTIEKIQGEFFVDGPGRVAFCPCPDPPLTLGFSSARVAATDLVLKNPTLRVGGVPIFWLPYFWVRSPRRPGLLPLKVAWRTDGGLLLGSGVHVPMGERDALDLGAAGYVRGGVDLDGRLSTRSSDSFVRWDYVDESMLAVDLRGAAQPVPGATLAWSADALRGPRALTGPILLEEAALRQDRARGALGLSNEWVTLGLTLNADSPRGGPIRSTTGVLGPGLHAGLGSGLGEAGTFDADVDLATLRNSAGASTTLIVHRGEARANARAGAVMAGVQAGSRVAVTLGERSAGHLAAVGAGGQVSAPFVKRFGSHDAPLEHWVTPFIAGSVGMTHWEAPSVAPPLAPNGKFGVLSPGIRTTMGEISGPRAALTISFRGGAVVDDRQSRGFVAVTGNGTLRPLSLRQESIVIPSESTAAVHVFNARLGTTDGAFVSLRLVEGVGDVPVLTRFAISGFGAAWDSAWLPWFEGAGSAVGGSLGVPWARLLASAADADYDVANGTLLGIRGSLAYLHPCGCLKVSLWGGERLGRSGFDSYVAVDLAPR